MSGQYQVTGSSAASISASIEAGVRAGDWVWGERLPPIRVLAFELHVSPATVSKAYQELRQRGIVESVGRSGTRVRTRPAVASPRSALRLPVPAGALDLSAGDPDTRLLPGLAPHLRAVSDEVGPPMGYAAAGAMPELIDAARPRLAADGVPVEGAAITVTSGTLDAIERLLSAHLRAGDSVAVEDPGWANLLDLLGALDITAVPVAVDDEGPLPDRLAAALAKGVRAVVVTARAQNPTGAAISAQRAAELRAVLADSPDVLLIEDDHAAELSGVPLHSLGGATTSWAFVRSASKPFGPDLRIAVLAGDEVTIARVVGRMRIGTGWVSTVLQRLLLRLWRDEDVAARIAAAGESYDRRRLALRDALAARGVRAHGTTGINLWVRVEDETRMVTALRDAGYAVAPGSLFRVEAPPGIRMTVSQIDDDSIEGLADDVAAAAYPATVPAPSR
ncbi:aminotransferase class I/II-fold pyridoxal phosphate-dependent enzyme [Amorphoplanes digitatis]|uniref:DNA-binding transcriptional MocR family regulator n=1 Tax=Actinoplanes digitatis TaxID=1868 RepID=A0A7W7HTK9_9ACTN|nr:aminotransferase class I/II-fold pyridoxal phosphate-dependent enzyme [Actinoplanes digitatis]MBB4760473.1 DNA-binding transcriptional MocR family regulator [Actinoplanes digitatis]BFE68625.1 aminotransferase class I/II-fold pyridoxal phosphate-dependent enzyme [Actinoplanes digitatis]GID95430.1 GntR family transcriptional regulator [Actinoplanes digitatis]